jgi:cysteine desulfurase
LASQRIYLDHAATTPVSEPVLAAMLPFFTQHGYNPSGLHSESRIARDAVEDARSRIAAILGCETGEIVFTGSGSEGANLAIKGVAVAREQAGRNRIVVASVEHQAVLRSAEYLRRHRGSRVDYLRVDQHGVVDLGRLERLLGDDLALVSVQYANNEVGTIQPLAEIAALLEGAGVTFHTDAVQAPGALPLGVDDLGVDLLSLAAHKFHGPKGVGVLYIRRGTRVVPQIQGGSQERGRRAGTENVPLIVGMATALEIAVRDRDANNRHNANLSRLLHDGLRQIPDLHFNGHPTHRLSNNTNVCLAGVKAEGLLLQLDRAGIAASSGSACTSASLEPSLVLLAMGIPPELAAGSLRLTTGPDNTEADIQRFLEVISAAVPDLRAQS